MKGLRVDLRGAAGRPWVPKREGPREEEAAVAEAGHELCEFQEVDSGCFISGETCTVVGRKELLFQFKEEGF